MLADFASGKYESCSTGEASIVTAVYWNDRTVDVPRPGGTDLG